jgi:hypothetical protein
MNHLYFIPSLPALTGLLVELGVMECIFGAIFIVTLIEGLTLLILVE